VSVPTTRERHFGWRIRSLFCAPVCCVLVTGCEWVLPSTPLTNLDVVFNTSVDHGEPNDAIVAPLLSEEDVFDQIPGKTRSHAATLTAFADGELLAAWYSYSGSDELKGSAIYTARRRSDALKWEEPQLLADRPEGDGNPVLYSEGDDVWFFQAVVPARWSTSHIEFQRSHDRGRTWASPRVLTQALGSNTRFPPIRTALGSLLLPAYDDFLGRSLFFESKDGENWEFLSAIGTASGDIQPSVARLSNGRLLAVMRNQRATWLWLTASDDGGRTWSQPVDAGFPNPGTPAVLLRLASGNLILVFNDSTRERRPLSMTLTRNEGQTWTAPRVLANGDSTYSYPSAVQTPDGLIHLVYSLGRDKIRHITVNEAWVWGS